MTQWTGDAWRKLSLDKMFVKKLFLKTGCLMTADCHIILAFGLVLT